MGFVRAVINTCIPIIKLKFRNSQVVMSRIEWTISILKGIFVTCVVAGSICVSQDFKITERPFLRDAIFYIGATYWAFCMFYKGHITLIHSIGECPPSIYNVFDTIIN